MSLFLLFSEDLLWVSWSEKKTVVRLFADVKRKIHAIAFWSWENMRKTSTLLKLFSAVLFKFSLSMFSFSIKEQCFFCFFRLHDFAKSLLSSTRLLDTRRLARECSFFNKIDGWLSLWRINEFSNNLRNLMGIFMFVKWIWLYFKADSAGNQLVPHILLEWIEFW